MSDTVGSVNRVEYRPIEAGHLHEGLRIVSAGLSPKDWVIVNGLQFVRPGVEVDQTRALMPDDKPSDGIAR